MNRWNTKKVVEQNSVVTFKADMTLDTPEMDLLLKELGNPDLFLPSLAFFPGGGGEPTLLIGSLSQGLVVQELERAGPSRVSAAQNTAMTGP